MCGLAHFFEREGLATTLVALVREHAEAMRPPRALWVPFELGRPFGNPGNAAQQTGILTAALALLDYPGPDPILTEFIDWDSATEKPSWQFPVTLDQSDVQSEANNLLPLWQRAQQRYGRTTVGISGLSPEQAIAFISRYHSDDPMPNPKGMAMVSRARFAIDDIKAFYMEAAAADGSPSSDQLQSWFWQSTLAGRMILDFQKNARSSEDKNLNQIAGSIVPAERTI